MSELDRWGGRCDLCHCFLEIGEVVYELLTPSTGTRAEGEAGTAFWAQDPRWAACADWMVGIELLDSGRVTRKEWLARAVDKSLINQRLIMVGGDDGGQLERELREGQLEHLVSTLSAFIANRAPGFSSAVNEGVPRGDA